MTFDQLPQLAAEARAGFSQRDHHLGLVAVGLGQLLENTGAEFTQFFCELSSVVTPEFVCNVVTQQFVDARFAALVEQVGRCIGQAISPDRLAEIPRSFWRVRRGTDWPVSRVQI